MFCDNCGTYLEDGAAFCTNCGQAVNSKNQNQSAQMAFTQENTVQKGMQQENVQQGNVSSVNSVQPNQMQTVSAAVNTAKKKGFNILALLCWAGLLLSLFLPYVSASADILGYSYSEEVKLFDAEDGIFFIAISIIGILLTVLKLNKISIAADVIAAGLVLFETVNTQQTMSYMRGMAEYGAGFYLGIIAAIGLIISIFWNKIVKPK